jgi:hypothetical protein
MTDKQRIKLRAIFKELGVRFASISISISISDDDVDKNRIYYSCIDGNNAKYIISANPNNRNLYDDKTNKKLQL